MTRPTFDHFTSIRLLDSKIKDLMRVIVAQRNTIGGNEISDIYDLPYFLDNLKENVLLHKTLCSIHDVLKNNRGDVINTVKDLNGLNFDSETHSKRVFETIQEVILYSSEDEI